jgi:hypothetical protein
LARRLGKKRQLEPLIPAAPARWILALAFALGTTAFAGERSLDLGDGKSLRFEVLDAAGASASARETALLVLRHLAAGEIREAAALSNAPAKREQVLRDYEASVGAQEFKRVFSQYLDRGDAIVAEVAIGAHRLVIWDLGGAARQLAGQYYVEGEGRFLLDDVPSETRANLRRVLQAYRREATATR